MLRARDLLLEELRAALVAAGEQRSRGDQLFRWIHQKGAASVAEMSDLRRATRERLAAALDLRPLAVEAVQASSDGTRKLCLRAVDGARIEAVLIPEDSNRAASARWGEARRALPVEGGRESPPPKEGKLTLCVSTQVGCALGCRFCATATLGLTRDLSAGEIVDEVYRARVLVAREPDGLRPAGPIAGGHGNPVRVPISMEGRISHLVLMGMGEPLHNYGQTVRAIRLLTHDLGDGFSTRRITVSTAGLVPGIERLGREEFQVNLAVSLNATTDELRSRLMPINKRYPLGALLGAIRAYPLARRRRVTFEYVLLGGLNDRDDDARRLVRLLHGIPAKVNLIPWNPHRGLEFERPTTAHVLRFQELLKRHGLAAYLRATRGDDIAAACGQLVAGDHGPSLAAVIS
ncbi:MAG: 23S rRNA (adenine(2503)-C(2))-methyltransferase RlmN [Deltaproteobacteria bacterium]|nr:23S rRNA (adenine(2503)-C(2))-methyltransferase RlmN [Deltaproteobacteria bacterium]